MICPICKKEMEIHPISGILTCFVHGNALSDDALERDIANEWIKQHYESH